MAIELTVDLSDLPDTLNAMREWLDHHKSVVTLFRSERDYDADGKVTISVGFASHDDSEAFRQHFTDWSP